MKEIATAFVKAQKQFSPALKTSTNPHFKSSYVKLDGCIEAVIDALNANGIALIQQTCPDDTGVAVRTVFLHESGEQLDGGVFRAPASKQDPQGYGSALTYVRRYSLMAACGIAPEDDDGNAASRPRAEAKNPLPETIKISEKQASELAALISETESDIAGILAFISKGAGYEVSSLKDAPIEAYAPVKKRLNEKIKHDKELIALTPPNQ